MQVRMTAAGLNFADIYRRKGHYVLHDQPPHIGGYEGVGAIIALGAGVTGWQLGQRVGFADVPFSHATRINVAQERALALPDELGDREAASVLLQGLTAQYLINDSVRVCDGDSVVVLAAAGGVGRILTRMLTARGARVYALASCAQKQAVARDNGAIAAMSYQQDWVGEIRSLTGGGVRYVFDSVGVTLRQSLAVLRAGGRVVSFGMAGGDTPAIRAGDLLMDSKGVIGADLWTYLDSGDARRERAQRLFDSLRQGEFSLPPTDVFSLEAGADAHRRLEDRAFAGKVVLVNDKGD
ncbi:zinc-binding dehydrogenase [Martelella alba]|uniref:Zinc-binding dehydrogenase n=1 Tax=Martelella alba TaxID=2590451 RepID=A0ABY2SIA5_9HYPH|nr:zinc-binding dehydrogenase [Martelella alba]TKI04803.1 zinc-binding dehydrogenase [Martelella alba]